MAHNKAPAQRRRIGDGVILSSPIPPIDWCLGFVREAPKEAGRDFSKIEVLAPLLPCGPPDGPEKTARETRAWFPALVSNHVMDIISK